MLRTSSAWTRFPLWMKPHDRTVHSILALPRAINLIPSQMERVLWRTALVFSLCRLSHTHGPWDVREKGAPGSNAGDHCRAWVKGDGDGLVLGCSTTAGSTRSSAGRLGHGQGKGLTSRRGANGEREREAKHRARATAKDKTRKERTSAPLRFPTR